MSLIRLAVRVRIALMSSLKEAKSINALAQIIKPLRRSVRLFPILLAIFLLIPSAAKISGTSVGIYNQFIYGDSTKDPNLLFSYPRPVRSDEWLVNTQLTIAQAKEGFPRVNQNIGNGRDMSLAGDVPYKDWSAVFRPQNLPFFILPLEYAFALKWWLILYLVIISCYFFTLRILPRKRLFAAIFSSAIGLSPFFAWWYLSGAMAPIFYGFFILIVGMRTINSEPVKFLKNKHPLYSNIAYILTLAYLLTSFALILYPPFQIPVAIVVFFFLIGYLVNKRFEAKLSWRQIGKKLAIFSVGLIIAGVLLGLFIATRKDAFSAITNTVYPSARVSTGGHVDSLHIFDSFLQPQLQSERRGTHFFKNQSEASNFILLSPFLVLPALALTIYEYRQKRRIDWLFVIIQLNVLLFFARVFVPFGDGFYKLLLFDKVPNERLIIGIGLVGILLTLLTYKKLIQLKISRRVWWGVAGTYTLVCFAVVSLIGFRVADMYPLFISYAPKILLLAASFCLIIWLFLIKRGVLAAIVLLLFSFGSVVKINPLYKGLGWINSNELFSRMQVASTPDDTWAAADVIAFENFGLLADRGSLSGIQPYPDFKLWRQVAGASADDTYNRYAHVVFVSSPQWSEPLKLIQPDFFEVAISCSDFITKNVDYILDTSPLNKPCLQLKDKVVYPSVSFHIYEVKPNNL